LSGVFGSGDNSRVKALYQLGVLLDEREQPAYAQILYQEAAAAGNRDAARRLDVQCEP
jgi:hypothetical protein